MAKINWKKIWIPIVSVGGAAIAATAVAVPVTMMKGNSSQSGDFASYQAQIQQLAQMNAQLQAQNKRVTDQLKGLESQADLNAKTIQDLQNKLAQNNGTIAGNAKEIERLKNIIDKLDANVNNAAVILAATIDPEDMSKVTLTLSHTLEQEVIDALPNSKDKFSFITNNKDDKNGADYKVTSIEYDGVTDNGDIKTPVTTSKLILTLNKPVVQESKQTSGVVGTTFQVKLNENIGRSNGSAIAQSDGNQKLPRRVITEGQSEMVGVASLNDAYLPYTKQDTSIITPDGERKVLSIDLNGKVPDFAKHANIDNVISINYLGNIKRVDEKNNKIDVPVPDVTDYEIKDGKLILYLSAALQTKEKITFSGGTLQAGFSIMIGDNLKEARLGSGVSNAYDFDGNYLNVTPTRIDNSDINIQKAELTADGKTLTISLDKPLVEDLAQDNVQISLGAGSKNGTNGDTSKNGPFFKDNWTFGKTTIGTDDKKQDIDSNKAGSMVIIINFKNPLDATQEQGQAPDSIWIRGTYGNTGDTGKDGSKATKTVITIAPKAE